MERRLTIADFLGAFRRRAWILVLAIVIGTPLSVSVAYLLPPVYRSTAMILVESEQIPSDLARSTVTTSTAERLQSIKQRLMTRENLLSIIDRLDLYANRPDMSPTEKVEKLRESTLFVSEDNPFGSGRRGATASGSTFTITFEADQARQAGLVANEIVTMFIERNLQSRNARATETNDFFKQEVKRLSGELLAIEGQITAYKNENEAALPDGLEFRRTELSDLGERMFEREQRRFGLEASKRALEKALITGDGTPIERQLSEDEMQLQTLERNYAQQSAIYAESHPTLRAMAARIKALRRKITPAAAGEDGASFRETEIAQKIELIENELARLTDQRAVDEARKMALETSIANTPEVEMALNVLNRRHSELQLQYEQLVLKQAEAETGEKLETNRQAERFEVIEQARIPEKPSAPKRMLIAVGGTFGSAALGIALMVMAEMLSKAIRTPRDLELQLNLRPVVTIPFIQTAADIHSRRLRMAVVVLALLVVPPGGLYAVDKYYLPLPLLVERLFDRTGIDVVLQLIEQRF